MTITLGLIKAVLDWSEVYLRFYSTHLGRFRILAHTSSTRERT